MRTVRVLLRRKSRIPDLRLSVKVVTNCRIPERKKPVQIHLGYLSLMGDGGIPQGQRSKLLKNLRRKWKTYFDTEEVDVDWVDAERKLDLLRAASAGAPGPVETSDPPALEVDRRRSGVRGPRRRLSESPAIPSAPADREQHDAGV